MKNNLYMVHADRRLAAVRDAGKAVVEVLDIGFRSAKYERKDETPSEQLEEDPRYGPCLEAIRSSMSEFASVEIREFPEAPDARVLEANRTFMPVDDEKFDEEPLCTLTILYRSDGTGSVILVAHTANGTIYPIDADDFELSTLQIGRYIAQAELAILVAELSSCAEALDYWIRYKKNLTYNTREGRYEFDSASNSPLASSWHTTRGVTRQAVSNNTSSAESKLHSESEGEDPWI